MIHIYFILMIKGHFLIVILKYFLMRNPDYDPEVFPNVILHVFPLNDHKVFPGVETQITILEHSFLMTVIGMQQKKFQ